DVAVRPRVERGNDALERAVRLAELAPDIVTQRADARLVSMSQQVVAKALARVGIQRRRDELCRAGRALDVENDRSRHAVIVSKVGKPLAISSPVKLPTQPSGSRKNRSAVNCGDVPMSNQCRVPAGTPSRSPVSHSTTCTLPSRRR